MIIKDIQTHRTGATTALSAKCKIRNFGWDRVYFSADNVGQDDYVPGDASPFAAALLLPSMKEGKDLIIEGSIPAQLYRGMHAIMREVLQWGIGLQPIKIETESFIVDPPRPQRSASFFSGGVDSFYTYLKHKTDPLTANRIDCFILINGFDIARRNLRLWDRTLENIKSVAAADNLDLIVVGSNVQELVEPILLWDYSHGGCLAAAGLFVRGAFHQIYIPSTHSLSEQIPWGSNLALDAHWSTESTTFNHDGTEATRLEKVISQIALSPLALKHLRVCFANEEGAYNCGRCDKCLRTMTNLSVAGALGKSATFPHHLDPDLVAAVPTIPGERGGIFHTENLRALQERNIAPELQQAISISMRNAAAMRLGPRKTIEDRLKYLDHVYARGYVYSVWERLFGRRFH
ncbi:MAG TPA: hypothetical protein VGH53_29680 [Streptosporangiaceae bacterium]|jgi:hypothetical protein